MPNPVSTNQKGSPRISIVRLIRSAELFKNAFWKVSATLLSVLTSPEPPEIGGSPAASSGLTVLLPVTDAAVSGLLPVCSSALLVF